MEKAVGFHFVQPNLLDFHTASCSSHCLKTGPGIRGGFLVPGAPGSRDFPAMIGAIARNAAAI
jgi:hypothetical protein